MDIGAPNIFIALESSGLGQAIRQSVWVYPAANVVHVVTVISFFAAVTVLDLILLGVVPGDAKLAIGARRFAIGCFVLVVTSGGVLFAAEASHLALNRVFQIKVAVITAALLNALWLGRLAIAALAGGIPSGAPRTTARIAAIVSLGLWLGAAALGRFIAYA